MSEEIRPFEKSASPPRKGRGIAPTRRSIQQKLESGSKSPHFEPGRFALRCAYVALVLFLLGGGGAATHMRYNGNSSFSGGFLIFMIPGFFAVMTCWVMSIYGMIRGPDRLKSLLGFVAAYASMGVLIGLMMWGGTLL